MLTNHVLHLFWGENDCRWVIYLARANYTRVFSELVGYRAPTPVRRESETPLVFRVYTYSLVPSPHLTPDEKALGRGMIFAVVSAAEPRFGVRCHSCKFYLIEDGDVQG